MLGTGFSIAYLEIFGAVLKGIVNQVIELCHPLKNV
jgi:hypothetical protein